MMTAHASTRARAFTLVELMMVVVIMGIVSVTVIPAMDNVRGMREGAARDDVARLFEVTKGYAIASGKPVGLRVALSESTLSIVTIDPAGGIVLLNEPLTGNARTLWVEQTYPGVTLTGFTNGDGVSGDGIVWFDFEANPHTRNPNGVFKSLNDDPAVITLSSSSTVIVHAYSGLVEKP